MTKIDLSNFKVNGKIKPPLIAEYIIKNHNSKQHFRMIEDSKEIWIYDKETGCFNYNGEDFIKNQSQKILGVESKSYFIAEVVKFFKNLKNKDGIVGSDKEYIINADDLDSNTRYINLKNGERYGCNRYR